MNKIETGIDGLVLVQPSVFSDARGFFLESFQLERYKSLGITGEFVQDNISKSTKGILRGLHFQIGNMAQGKLCQVISGEVLDVAVDLRVGSPTYGKYFSVLLSGENHKQLFLPAGFAHGFSVQSDEAIFHYKCTQYYSKEHERTILYSDPTLNVDWQIDSPLVSERDAQGLEFKTLEKYFYYQ